MKAAAIKDCSVQEMQEFDSVTKREIFEKVSRRLAELHRVEFIERECCPELNPDVIVISADQTLLFEPQNKRASEVLRQRLGLGNEGIQVSERIRVHPCMSQKIIDALKFAGLSVVC